MSMTTNFLLFASTRTWGLILTVRLIVVILYNWHILILVQRLIVLEPGHSVSPVVKLHGSLLGWEEAVWSLEDLRGVRWVMHQTSGVCVRAQTQRHTNTSVSLLTLPPPDNQSLWLHYSVLGCRGDPTFWALTKLSECWRKSQQMMEKWRDWRDVWDGNFKRDEVQGKAYGQVGDWWMGSLMGKTGDLYLTQILITHVPSTCTFWLSYDYPAPLVSTGSSFRCILALIQSLKLIISPLVSAWVSTTWATVPLRGSSALCSIKKPHQPTQTGWVGQEVPQDSQKESY